MLSECQNLEQCNYLSKGVDIPSQASRVPNRQPTNPKDSTMNTCKHENITRTQWVRDITYRCSDCPTFLHADHPAVIKAEAMAARA